MNITCISASNISVAREHSASTRTCELVRELVSARQPAAQVKIIAMIDYKLKPCRMCGKCYPSGMCSHDKDFNALSQKMAEADALILVCPHYAPIPSKVMIVLEKLQEMAYLNWCADQKYRPPLSGRPIGIIAHGGRTDPEALPYYKTALLDPLAGSFASIGMTPIGAGEAWPNGVTFGIKSLSKPADSIFVDIEHDWDHIRQKVTPLVENVLRAVRPL